MKLNERCVTPPPSSTSSHGQVPVFRALDGGSGFFVRLFGFLGLWFRGRRRRRRWAWARARQRAPFLQLAGGPLEHRLHLREQLGADLLAKLGDRLPVECERAERFTVPTVDDGERQQETALVAAHLAVDDDEEIQPLGERRVAVGRAVVQVLVLVEKAQRGHVDGDLGFESRNNGCPHARHVALALEARDENPARARYRAALGRLGLRARARFSACRRRLHQNRNGEECRANGCRATQREHQGSSTTERRRRTACYLASGAMIHRSFGPGLVWGLALAMAIGWTARANACVTTTCAVKNPPPECVRDPGTSCWIAGIPLQWREPCVSFSVDARGIPSLGLGFADTEALVTGSFALWPTASCGDSFPSISVQSAGASQCARIEYNDEGPNSNSIIFQSASWPHDALALGVTTVSFDAETGRIVDADIEINLATGGLEISNVSYVVAHEAGHYFGIDHSAEGTALMFAQTSLAGFDAPPLLTADDVNAICLAYPPTRAVGVCDFEPEKGYSPVCGGDIEGSCAMATRSRPGRTTPDFVLFFAMLGAWLVRSRSRRRTG